MNLVGSIFLRRAAAAAVAVTIPISAIVTSVNGQERIRESDRRMLERREREFALKRLEAVANQPEKPREKKLSLAQIGEDFSRIQSASDDMVRPLLRGDELDYKFIAKTATEIKKRAKRLKENLQLPAGEKDAEPFKVEACTEPGQLKAALTALSHAIANFVTNPVFQKANVIDAGLSSKAGVDLDHIIELSDAVKDGGERLNRLAQSQ